jgi:hypothetical protein
MDINRDIEDLKKAIHFVMDDDERLYLVAKRLSKLLSMKRQESNNMKYQSLPLAIRFRDRDGKWHHVQLDDSIPFTLMCPCCNQPVDYDPKTRTLFDPKKSRCSNGAKQIN